MHELTKIHFDGNGVEVYVYAEDCEDMPSLLCDARKAVTALLDVEETNSDAEVVCTGHLATTAAPGGFQANGQIIAAIGALVQKAITNAPALIAELQTLAPEIEALIALFGKTPASAT